MIEINNLTKFPVDKKFFLAVAKKVLKGENKELEDLSIAFVSAEEIRKANRDFRKKDKATDVLSFEKSINFKEDFSEVIICPDVVIERTSAMEEDLKMELAKVLIHGILHNFGYDHERSNKDEELMEQKQKYYLSKI